MDRYDMPSGRRTDGNGDFIDALVATLRQIVTRRAGVTPLPDAQTDRRFAGLAGSQGGQMPGYEAARAMRGMFSPSGETVSPDSAGERSGAGAASGGMSDSPLERLAARLAQMGLVDTEAGGDTRQGGTNVPRKSDGYR